MNQRMHLSRFCSGLTLLGALLGALTAGACGGGSSSGGGAPVSSTAPGLSGASGVAVGPGAGSAPTTPAGGSPVVPPAAAPPGQGMFRAGAAAVDVTPPVGVPLGGFGEGQRRLSFPDLDPTNLHTFIEPSTGVADPIYAKALVLESGGTKVGIITVDLVATSAQAVDDIQRRAASLGVNIPLDDLLVMSSHTHSGPGAITPLHLWELLAMDLFQPTVYDGIIDGCVQALIQADAALGPATFAAGSTQVHGITHNRRAPDSPVLDPDSVDPELGVIRIDRPGGAPVATIWNYAIHGLIHGPQNSEISADLFGYVSGAVENGGGGVALFANGAEGDISPNNWYGGAPAASQLAGILGPAILNLRASLTPTATVDLRNRSEWIDLGAATVSIDVNRIGQTGSSFVQTLQRIPGISIGIGFSVGSSWMEHRFRFQAIRLNDVVISSIPGEAIHTIGLDIKAHGSAQGYAQTFVFGLANGHMAYITTPDEYDYGGYESLATFFGRTTGDVVLAECKQLLDILR